MGTVATSITKGANTFAVKVPLMPKGVEYTDVAAMVEKAGLVKVPLILSQPNKRIGPHLSTRPSLF